MFKTNKLKQFTILFVLIQTLSYGQGLIDGSFSKKNDVITSAAFIYNYYDTLFVMGDTEVSPIPDHQKVEQYIYNLYLSYGLSDNIQLIANLPYIQAQGDGIPDRINGRRSLNHFQDLSLAGKFKFGNVDFEGGAFNLIAGVGLAIPLGYEPNGILGIGHGAVQYQGSLGAHLQFESSFYGTLVGGYDLRGRSKDNFNTVPAEKFDVPDAYNFLLKTGYSLPFVSIDGWLQGTYAINGVDIQGEGFSGNFPEVQSKYTSVGASLYFPVVNYLGISGSFSKLISGENTADFTNFAIGIVCAVNKIRPSTPQ